MNETINRLKDLIQEITEQNNKRHPNFIKYNTKYEWRDNERTGI